MSNCVQTGDETSGDLLNIPQKLIVTSGSVRSSRVSRSIFSDSVMIAYRAGAGHAILLTHEG